jgi:hypothetical protein
MLERLIDSQQKMACFPFLFRINDQLSALENTAPNTHDMHATPEERHINNLKKILERQYLDLIDTATGINPFRNPDQTITEATHISGIPLRKILDGLSLISLSNKLEELQNIECRLGEFFDIDVFAVHYTRCVQLAPRYLEKNNSYWLELVRHPYDRIMSEILVAPQRKFTHILQDTQEYFSFIQEFRHDRFLLVKYEDFCARPEEELNKISEWLGEKVEIVPLLNLYGEPFYPNTSQSVYSGKSYFFQNKDMSSKIGSLDPARWRDKIPRNIIAAINARINFEDFYAQTKTSHTESIAGWAKLILLESRECLRGFIIQVFKIIGLNISRKQ